MLTRILGGVCALVCLVALCHAPLLPVAWARTYATALMACGLFVGAMDGFSRNR